MWLRCIPGVGRLFFLSAIPVLRGATAEGREGALLGARRAKAEPAEGEGITILIGGLKGGEALAEELAQRVHSAGAV